MGQDIKTSHFTKKDFQAFKERLIEETALLETWFKEGTLLTCDHGTGGFELEAWLVNDQADPLPIVDDFLKLIDNRAVVPELAKFNLELNVPHQRLKGHALNRLKSSLEEIWKNCQRRAGALDARLMMIGILPTVKEEELSLANMTERSRYQALNEQVLFQRHGRPIQLDIHGHESLSATHTDVMLESATTSFQIHLQISPDQAVRFYNAALIISASMVAVCANSPYLFGKSLWSETRIPLFEQAVAITDKTRDLNRVGFGHGYAKETLLEFFIENQDLYPVLLPMQFDSPPEDLSHLRLHNGTIWRWNRPLIGFEDGVPHLRIEHRVSAAGPSVIDSIANAALFFGLVQALATLEVPPETLLSFSQAEHNFYLAAKQGLAAEIVWLDGKTIRLKRLFQEKLIPLAYQGLAQLELDRKDIALFLGVIEGRASSGQNGAAWQRAYVARHGCNMKELVLAYWERQQSGLAVHEWPLR